MDVFLLLVLASAGLIAFWRGLGWALKIDSSRRGKHRKRKKSPQDKAIDAMFFELVRPIWKRPVDE